MHEHSSTREFPSPDISSKDSHAILCSGYMAWDQRRISVCSRAVATISLCDQHEFVVVLRYPSLVTHSKMISVARPVNKARMVTAVAPKARAVRPSVVAHFQVTFIGKDGSEQVVEVPPDETIAEVANVRRALPAISTLEHDIQI